jgi:hypothetical protein
MRQSESADSPCLTPIAVMVTAVATLGGLASVFVNDPYSGPHAEAYAGGAAFMAERGHFEEKRPLHHLRMLANT